MRVISPLQNAQCGPPLPAGTGRPPTSLGKHVQPHRTKFRPAQVPAPRRVKLQLLHHTLLPPRMGGAGRGHVLRGGCSRLALVALALAWPAPSAAHVLMPAECNVGDSRTDCASVGACVCFEACEKLMWLWGQARRARAQPLSGSSSLSLLRRPTATTQKARYPSPGQSC